MDEMRNAVVTPEEELIDLLLEFSIVLKRMISVRNSFAFYKLAKIFYSLLTVKAFFVSKNGGLCFRLKAESTDKDNG